MATIILCGLESKPKLNGRDIKLIDFHADKGRWEVELEGDLPMVDLFRIDWHKNWDEPLKEDTLKLNKPPVGPSFKEFFEQELEKRKCAHIRKEIIALDNNMQTIWALDSEGEVTPDLQGSHINRRAEAGHISEATFPLYFQKHPAGGKTLAVRPCCLRVREDESVEKLRSRKVEMLVGANHSKPILDGQYAALGPWQATSYQWAVRPDIRGLWDVNVDGSGAPVLLHSREVLDEANGQALQDPVRIASWSRVSGQKAVYARFAYQRGQVILEEEASILARKPSAQDLLQVWRQFLQLPDKRQEEVLDLCRGEEGSGNNCMWRFLQRDPPFRERVEMTRKMFEDECEDFRNLSSRDREQAWNVMRAFDTNCLQHAHWEGRLLYLFIGRINHSCKPNAVLVDPKLNPDSQNPRKKTLIALCDIAEGEEITVSYLSEDDLLQPYEQRQKSLTPFGFKCVCASCSDESYEGNFRVFACKATESCSGTHAATHSALQPCCACGVEASDPQEVLTLDAMFSDTFSSLMQNLTAEDPLTSPNPLVQIVEAAEHSGCAPTHWVVCKARDVLSCFYQKNRRPELAADNIEPILELQARALGYRGWQRQEARGNHLAQLGRFKEAFACYVEALVYVKQMSPDLHVAQSQRSERIRTKLREVIDAQAPQADDN